MEQNDSRKQDENPWPSLPNAFQHRLSSRWTTMEALRILQDRMSVQGHSAAVLLLTPMGPICGKLTDITDSYEASMDVSKMSDVDVASATAHLRTDVWRMYEKKDPSLQPVDSAALVHVKDASFRVGNRRVKLQHLALFAGDILGYALLGDDAPPIP